MKINSNWRDVAQKINGVMGVDGLNTGEGLGMVYGGESPDHKDRGGAAFWFAGNCRIFVNSLAENESLLELQSDKAPANDEALRTWEKLQMLLTPPIGIDKENITIGELEELVQAGNKEAIELWEKWEKELAPLREEVRKTLIWATKKTFENDPAKPFFEMLNSMSTSKNPIHRAIVKPYGAWSIAKVKKHGAKLLADELSKSANELPVSIDTAESDNKLTLRQVDNVVQSNLFVIKGWEHERQEQGATILYTVWTNAISPKLYLGVFRVWEWVDGSGRCGWQSLPDITPEQKKLRDFFHLEMVVSKLVKPNKKINDQSAVQVDPGQEIEPPKPENNIRCPKRGTKKHNDWKATWRKVKGSWHGGNNYQQLAKLARVSNETIADIVKAGDAGLLD